MAKFTVPLLAALMLVGPTQTPSATAADLPDADVSQVMAESGWLYEITPYGWLPGIKGDVAVFGSGKIGLDVTFDELLDAVDWGNFPAIVMMKGEVRNDRFGLFADVLHFAVAVGGSGTGPPPLNIPFDVGVGAEITAATALGFYRIVEEGESHLDVLAGGRLFVVDVDLDLSAGPLGGSASDDNTWVDPVIGLKGQYGLNDKFFVEGWGLIGGFGVSSDFMWDVYGGVGYEVKDWFSAAVGWRHIGVDYSNGSFLFDVDFDGPMFSGTFRF